MDHQGPISISPHDLYARLGNAAAPLIIDVRPDADFNAAGHMLAGAVRRAPESAEQWRAGASKDRPIVLHGGEGEAAGIAEALCKSGGNARYLQGGFTAWIEGSLPLRRKRGSEGSRWVTCEHPKIDRIACPWLVSRFIDPLAEFLYVPPHEVARIARETGGSPYDIKGVEFGLWVTAARSMPSCAPTTSTMRRSIIWRRSSGAPTLRGPASRRRAKACWRSRRGSRAIFPMITQC